MSYRTTVRHVCAATPVVVTAVGETAELPPLAGWSLLGGDKFEEAIEEFDSALELDPNRADGHAGRALALAMIGNDAEAVAAMRRAVDLDVNVLLNLPEDDATRGVLAHLTDVYRKQTEAAEHPVDLWFMIAAMETARQDYPAAGTSLERAVEAGDVQPSTSSLRHFVENELKPR